MPCRPPCMHALPVVENMITDVCRGWSGPASKGIDGNTNTQYSGGSCTHTYNKPKEWWKLAFGKTRTVTKVKVWNRTCLGGLSFVVIYQFIVLHRVRTVRSQRSRPRILQSTWILIGLPKFPTFFEP